MEQIPHSSTGYDGFVVHHALKNVLLSFLTLPNVHQFSIL